ncbi:hypothetical protein Acr_08g0010190 [Actinidia rufa]|uniref:Uncharacterized protein n=1 Tax=Actinidia rufa TaxID=165716 RepID=A0A7J0F1Z6_9ERIC|nr:hypothetical protein Acr_08g0010190 [Actinidia rufa]
MSNLSTRSRAFTRVLSFVLLELVAGTAFKVATPPQETRFRVSRSKTRRKQAKSIWRSPEGWRCQTDDLGSDSKVTGGRDARGDTGEVESNTSEVETDTRESNRGSYSLIRVWAEQIEVVGGLGTSGNPRLRSPEDSLSMSEPNLFTCAARRPTTNSVDFDFNRLDLGVLLSLATSDHLGRTPVTFNSHRPTSVVLHRCSPVHPQPSSTLVGPLTDLAEADLASNRLDQTSVTFNSHCLTSVVSRRCSPVSRQASPSGLAVSESGLVVISDRP